MLGDGEGGHGIGKMGRLQNVAVEFHQAGGESADESVAGAGRVDGVDIMRIDLGVNIGLGNETAAGAKGDDDDGDIERAAKAVHMIGRPVAIASNCATARPSDNDGKTKRSAV